MIKVYFKNDSIKDLAFYIDRSVQNLYYMKKNNPKIFKLLMRGWNDLCKDHNA